MDKCLGEAYPLILILLVRSMRQVKNIVTYYICEYCSPGRVLLFGMSIKNFNLKKNFSPKNFLVQKKLWSKEYFGEKIFSPRNF